MHAKATECFSQYKRELHRYLMRRLRQPQDADDLAGEVYLRLCKIEDDKDIDEPLAYLYGIAAHVLADWRNHEDNKADAIHRCDSYDDGDLSELPQCIVPDDLELRLNLQQQIDHALAQLPATHAAVLLCHKRDGMSYVETAEKLGLSVHTVEKYVTVGKFMMRHQLWDR